MTETTVRQVFSAKIDVDIINLSPSVAVEVQTFTTTFQSASETPTYAELVAIDGGVLGYIPFFDQCKAEGILS